MLDEKGLRFSFFIVFPVFKSFIISDKIFIEQKISANGGELTLKISSTGRKSYCFSCEITVSRSDGSKFDSTKNINLYRNIVQKICDRQRKSGIKNFIVSFYHIL